MDAIDRTCMQAARERQRAFDAYRRHPSAKTYAAYARAFAEWDRAIGPQADRQEVWQAGARRSVAGLFEAVSRTLPALGRFVTEVRRPGRVNGQ